MRKSKYLILFFYCFLLLPNIYCQLKENIEKLHNQYEKFEYQDAIRTAEKLIVVKDSLSVNEIMDVLVIKSISHYSLNEMKSAKRCFIEILEIQETYQLDKSIVSPKIITFFEDTRDDYLQISSEFKTEENISDSLFLEQIKITEMESDLFKTACIKSIFFPGWGHFEIGNNTKGWILSSLNAVNLGTLIYFVFDCDKKEKDYMSETNFELIEQKYTAYNKSYKTRNILFFSYLTIWLYSQIDIWFFSHDNIDTYFSIEKITYQSQEISLQFNYRFNL
ncbi:MAG: hypothetical protein JXA68_06480 [Ignavibacteriales bacterium]|nr:hypothetical protein [Ignavibacteriales bacterium]